MNRTIGAKNGFRVLIMAIGTLLSPVSIAGEGGDLAGVYVGEQPGAYLQNRMSSRTAIMFSAHSINNSYWISGDVKYYLGNYADSIYVAGGLTYAKEQGLPSENIYRAGGGWETRTESSMVYGIGATVWWNQAWVEPIVRAGIYIAYYR